jgi:hypothetical protein
MINELKEDMSKELKESKRTKLWPSSSEAEMERPTWGKI